MILVNNWPDDDDSRRGSLDRCPFNYLGCLVADSSKVRYDSYLENYIISCAISAAEHPLHLHPSTDAGIFQVGIS